MNTARVCLLTFGVAAVAACSQQAMPTATRAPRALRADFADNPSSPSTIVIRRDGIPVRVITTDTTQGLMAIHGPVDVPVCTNATTRDSVDGQQILTPSDAQGIRLLLQASQSHVEIYNGINLAAVFPFVASSFCNFVATTPKAYEGIVAYHVNLGSSMTSFRWEGDVTRVSDGATFHYVENQDVVATGKTTSSYIRIQGNGGN